MCIKSVVGEGVGSYGKGNEPQPIHMRIELGVCRCHSHGWARIPGGKTWVEIL